MNYTAYEAYQLTPKTNCGKCGYSRCSVFAKNVENGRANIRQCPYFYHADPADSRSPQFEINADVIRSGILNGLSSLLDAVSDVISTTSASNPRRAETRQTPAQPKPKPKRRVNEQGAQSMSMAQTAAFYDHELKKAEEWIEDAGISADLTLIRTNIIDIYETVCAHPFLEPQVRKFSQTDLPALMSVVNWYLSLEDHREHDGESEASRAEIAETIAKAKEAFLNLNDDLFRQISFDIDVQIKSFDDMLTIDGLMNTGDFTSETQKDGGTAKK